MQNGISLLADHEFQRQGWRQAGNVLWNFYECADGEWIAFSMSQGDRYWPAMCRALDKAEWLEDDRFNSLEARYENREFVIEQMAEVLKTRPPRRVGAPVVGGWGPHLREGPTHARTAGRPARWWKTSTSSTTTILYLVGASGSKRQSGTQRTRSLPERWLRRMGKIPRACLSISWTTHGDDIAALQEEGVIL